MRVRVLMFLLAFAPVAAAQDQVPRDIAAMHREGKWKIRKADLYRYLVRYYKGQPTARMVLPEYMKRRLVEERARQGKLGVTEAELDAWLAALDAQVRRQTGKGLADMRDQLGMRPAELKRRGRLWLLQEKVARAEILAKDPSRPKDQRLSEDTVILVIDTLYKNAPKKYEKLPAGVVARIGKTDITEYEYGRTLAYELPTTEVVRALADLILFEEVALLVGDRKAPSKADLEVQKQWYLTAEKNRIRRMPRAPARITDDIVKQVLEQRGLTLEDVYSGPAFLAQARAVGHFRRKQTDEALTRYYTANRGRYGDQIQIARILVGARAQNVPGVGRKIRTLGQGKAIAEQIWTRLQGGEDFADLARKHSEDADVIRKAGGFVPIWVTEQTPGYQDSFRQARPLKNGDITKPFYSSGRGYVIVKLLARRPALAYELLKEDIRADAATQEYGVWRRTVTRDALKNPDLLEKK
jgi:hypothetical protein